MENTMRDYLLDIIKNTHGLNDISVIKVIGTEEETKLAAVGGQAVVVSGKFHNPSPDFIGHFGMPNLSRLLVTLNTDEYREEANINVIRENGEPSDIHFENKNGDFRNTYRLMSRSVVNTVVPDVEFTGAKWHVELVPTVQSIQRLKFQSTINNSESHFSVKTDDKNNLIFRFGDPASGTGQFIFQSSVTGTLKSDRYYPIQLFLTILNLNGDKTMKFSNDGVAMITVDSGLGLYTYTMPAVQK